MHQRLILLFALLFGLSLHATAEEEELLRPDQAFAISAQTIGSDRVRVSWVIADGYYLYASKFRFSTEDAGFELGTPVKPPALDKDDPVFGMVKIYRENVSIDLPLLQSPPENNVLALKARIQGCADIGVCFPPHNQTVLVALDESADAPPPVDPNRVDDISVVGSAPPAASTPQSDPLDELSSLGEELGLGFEEDDILPVEQAFKAAAEAFSGDTLTVTWTIAEGTYLYQDQISIAVQGEGIQAGTPELPPADIKKDSVKPDGTIGDVPVYHDKLVVEVPLIKTSDAAGEITVDLRYQGCAERGICYPPQKSSIKVAVPAGAGSTAAAAPIAASAAATAADSPVSEQDQIAAMIAGESTWVIIGAFFLIGLGLAFTPCVFPMIPILSGIITGHGKDLTTRKAFVVSLVYVLSMAVTYTVAGVIAASMGENLQAALQNPVALGIFALIFVLLALSMFGFYDLQLPSSWQAKLATISNKQEGGNLTGVAVMGLLSALIVGPCVAPPLAGALIYIGQTGDQLLGGLALFAMAMGMGAPLLLIGTSAGKLLPHAGAWMDGVKAVFGVVMLAVAIYLLERVLPEQLIMLLWGTLMIVSAVYMGALKALPAEASGWRTLFKGLGVALLVYGITFLVGIAANGHDTRQPLRGLMGSGGSSAAVDHVEFKRIKTIDDLNRELAAAKAQGKPVMLDFYADWCTYCKTMEKEIFPNPAVRTRLEKLVLLQADITDQDAADAALSKHLDMLAPPALYFWGSDGVERRNFRLVGNVSAAQLAQHIEKANL